MNFIDPFNAIKKSRSLPALYTFSVRRKLIIKFIFFIMLVPVFGLFLYCSFATQAIRDDSAYFFMPWLEYSKPFVIRMAQFVPIINHVSSSGNYPDYYVALYQNIYAVNWFVIFFCMLLIFIQILILQWDIRLERNYLDIKDSVKLSGVSMVFIFFLIHSEFIGTLSLSTWPIFLYFAVIMILLSFYGIMCGLLRIIMISLIYFKRSTKDE